MKASVLIALVIVCASIANAQVGAKVDEIVIQKELESITLRHCIVTEVQAHGAKVKHDDGYFVVPYQFVPKAWKAAINQQEEIEDAKAKEEKRRLAMKSDDEIRARQLKEDADYYAKTAPAREVCADMLKKGIVSEDTIKSWWNCVKKNKIVVGMPAEVAILSFPFGAKKSVYSDGTEIWEVMSGTLYFRNGILKSWEFHDQ